MYSLLKPFRSDTISIAFETRIFPGAADPFVPLVIEYAKEYGLRIEAVDRFYQYKFDNDEFGLRFRWDGNFTVYVYVPIRRDYSEVERRLKQLTNKLNRDIRDNKTDVYKPLSMI